jgi:hypothetical protein
MAEMIHLPRSTFERLKMYRKVLEATKKPYISSDEIARFLEINPDLVRKDFSYLKCQGKPRVGYDVEELRKELDDLFGVNNTTNMIIVGANDLARALLSLDFSKAGVKVVAVFDTEKEKVRCGDSRTVRVKGQSAGYSQISHRKGNKSRMELHGSSSRPSRRCHSRGRRPNSVSSHNKTSSEEVKNVSKRKKGAFSPFFHYVIIPVLS